MARDQRFRKKSAIEMYVHVKVDSIMGGRRHNVSVNLEFAARNAIKAARRKGAIILIDVLRCCSTIVTALANGAKCIIPTKTLAEARELHRRHPEYILAGERGGLKPKGFHLGNSPLEFQPEKVRGKNILLTTTDGTKAITLAKDERWVFIGSLLNAKTVSKTAFEIAEREGTGISIILSGRKGAFSLEDFLCAGAISQSLPANAARLSDAVRVASLAFQKARGQLDAVIQSADHAQRLKGLGLEEDVKFCAQLNVFKIVPFLKD